MAAADIPDRAISIEQYANDVAGLLKYLGIPKANFFGESDAQSGLLAHDF
jgi:pimeloyl-ACP methyl ester carboxylesterase